MLILKQSYEFVQGNILPHIVKRHQGMFLFGFEALTIKPFVSLNGNARTTIQGRKTAESKIYRLMTHEVFLRYFPTLVLPLGLVTATDTVNVDFSPLVVFKYLHLPSRQVLDEHYHYMLQRLRILSKLRDQKHSLFKTRSRSLSHCLDLLLISSLTEALRVRILSHFLSKNRFLLPCGFGRTSMFCIR